MKKNEDESLDKSNKEHQIWLYDFGVWKQYSYSDLNLLEALVDETQEEFLEKNGYWTHADYKGDRDGRVCEFYSHQKQYKYFCSMSFGGSEICEFIIANFPSRLMFENDYGHLFELKTKDSCFLKTSLGRYLNKNNITELVPQFYQKGEVVSLIGYDKDGEAIQILDEVPRKNYYEYIETNGISI